VRLIGVEVGGAMDCRGGRFNNPGGNALLAEGMAVRGSFVWQPVRPAGGVVDLGYARAGQFIDSKQTWPPAGGIVLNGFTYEDIVSVPEVSLSDRIRWLERNHPYSPQPYEQLMQVCRRQGNEAGARAVAIAKERVRRKKAGLGRWARAWSRFLGATVGYGYRSWLALVWLGTFWVAGALLFSWGPGVEDALIPLNEPGRQPPFEPLVYALDILIPLVDLRQREFWLPDISEPWGWLYMTYFRVGLLAGWALTSTAVAAVAGLLKRG
jgi:hypothetical protein